MAISEEKNEWLTGVLQDLEPETKNMGQASQNFVRDQIKRHSQYNEAIFISPKQEQWLRDLHQKYCAIETETQDESGTKEDHRYGDEPDDDEDYERGGSREIDDEIPF